MEITFLNTRVTPHIETYSYPTKSTRKWSSNLFFDPKDNEIWDEQDLSSIEKGHIYLWKEDSGSWIHVFMPYRIMDLETASLLQGFKTYRSSAPLVSGMNSTVAKFSKNPRTCLQNFRFTKEYFPQFKERVENLKGLLEKDEVDVDSLISKIRLSIKSSKIVYNSVSTFRGLYCSANGIKLDNVFRKDEALKEFSDAREIVTSLSVEKLQLAKELDKLNKEVSKETSYIQASEWFNTLSNEISNLREVDFDRLERETIHKHKVDMGYSETSSRPPTLMSLSNELAHLEKYYPSLQKVKAVGDNVLVELPGLSITFLSDGTVKVSGDPGVLKPYAEGSTSVQVKGRRKRSIHTKGDL